MKAGKLRLYAVGAALGVAVAIGSDEACDYVHNKLHDPSEIVKSTARMYSEPINNSQDDQIRVVFGVTPEYRPVAEALLHDDTVIGLEAPRWISGVSGGAMEVYDPEIHKIVRPEEIEKMKIGEDGEITYVPDETRKLEIISPRQNKAFKLNVRLNRTTGIYEKEWDTSDAPESRFLVPWTGGIGGQHNQFLSESEQKRFGTTWLKPYISLLDHSESYVSFLKGNYRIFNSPNWKQVAEESLNDIRSGNIVVVGEYAMTIAKAVNNSSTLDRVDITLYGRWPKPK